MRQIDKLKRPFALQFYTANRQQIELSYNLIDVFHGVQQKITGVSFSRYGPVTCQFGGPASGQTAPVGGRGARTALVSDAWLLV